MVYIYYYGKCTSSETFSFTFSAGPPRKFCFDRPLPAPALPNRPCKRRRALSDVDGDGDGSEARKKRRLRLYLVTSRLSRPFSQPASNIVHRGGSKVAIWGKTKPLGRNWLRKAAIMNRIRLRVDAANVRRPWERGRGTVPLREIVVPKPRCHEMPLPPSPLGLSNYDALDLEDELEGSDDEGGGAERCSSIYSDFNIMNPVTSDGDAYDYLDALDGILPEDLPDTPPPPPPEDSIVELLRDRRSQGQSMFVQLGGQ